MLDRPADPDVGPPIPGRGPRQPSSDPQPPSTRDSLSGIILAIRQRRSTLIATIVLIPLCAWLTLHQVTPLYTATGSLIYEPGGYRLRELQSILREDPTTEGMMASQAEILHSLRIAQKVAERGNLFTNPEFNVALQPPGLAHRLIDQVRWLLGMETELPSTDTVFGPVPDPSRNRTLLAVQDRLRAAAVRFSHVIEVSFVADNALVAATAVNNAMDAYIKDQYAAKHRLVDNATALLQKQAAELRQQVRQAEERTSAYRDKHALSQGMHAGTDTEEITNLTQDLAKAQSDGAAATARLDAARGRIGAEAQAAVSPSVVQLRVHLDRLSGQLQAQMGRLGSAHPDVQSLTRQIADSQRAIHEEITRAVAATEAEQHAAAERVEFLEAVLKQTKAAAQNADKAQIPLNAMTRDLDAARGQLQSVLERIQQTAQQAAVESSEAHEISQALPPDYPTSPRTVPIMAGSIVAAGFLGLLLVYLLQLTDTSIRSGDEIRRLTGLPCLALIPEVRRRALGHLKIHDYVVRRPLTAYAEQVRSLRAGISLDIDHPHIITVTAARPSEGKSLMTLALGRSAQLGGERVLIVECDVRQPSLQYRFGADASPGLLEVLRGEAKWQETIQSDPLTGMKYITAGKPGGDILGLFLSEKMRQILTQMREDYDIILLDAPPVEAMTEARIAASLADATVLCVRWSSTQIKTLLHAIELLHDARVRIIGTVMTRVDPRAHLRSGHGDSGVYHRRYKAYYRG